ncbi:hypothetical protein FB451DRAFT_1188746 [Mycena latifolia]|nr:hypothetical protein FB451DRAFT_1188746 [Mycena latifolia]
MDTFHHISSHGNLTSSHRLGSGFPIDFVSGSPIDFGSGSLNLIVLCHCLLSPEHTTIGAIVYPSTCHSSFKHRRSKGSSGYPSEGLGLPIHRLVCLRSNKSPLSGRTTEAAKRRRYASRPADMQDAKSIASACMPPKSRREQMHGRHTAHHQVTKTRLVRRPYYLSNPAYQLDFASAIARLREGHGIADLLLKMWPLFEDALTRSFVRLPIDARIPALCVHYITADFAPPESERCSVHISFSTMIVLGVQANDFGVHRLLRRVEGTVQLLRL